MLDDEFAFLKLSALGREWRLYDAVAPGAR